MLSRCSASPPGCLARPGTPPSSIRDAEWTWRGPCAAAPPRSARGPVGRASTGPGPACERRRLARATGSGSSRVATFVGTYRDPPLLPLRRRPPSRTAFGSQSACLQGFRKSYALVGLDSGGLRRLGRRPQGSSVPLARGMSNNRPARLRFLYGHARVVHTVRRCHARTGESASAAGQHCANKTNCRREASIRPAPTTPDAAA